MIALALLALIPPLLEIQGPLPLCERPRIVATYDYQPDIPGDYTMMVGYDGLTYWVPSDDARGECTGRVPEEDASE